MPRSNKKSTSALADFWQTKLPAQLPGNLNEFVTTPRKRPQVAYTNGFYTLSVQELKFKNHLLHHTPLNILISANQVITPAVENSPLLTSVAQELAAEQALGTPSDWLIIFLDNLIDQYFSILETFNEEIDRIENEIVEQPSATVVKKLYRLKKAILRFNQAIWPLREVITFWDRDPGKMLSATARDSIHGLAEHLFEIIDTTTFLRDLASELMDIYLSSINNRINDVMRILTLIATIFMPLTFVTSIYGMNFKFMPELEWGYLWILIIIALIAGTMIWIFKKKKLL